MNLRAIAFSGRFPAILLLCAMLGACSTTQKSSSGAGTQDAAPISEAGKTEPGKPADPVTSSAASPSSGSATPAGTGAGAAQAGKGDEEAARLKQQLASQDAEINRLRDEQVNAQRLADEEAARHRAEESAAASSSGSPSSQPQGAEPGTSQSAASQPGAAASGSAASGTAAAGSSEQAPAPGQPLQRSIYFEYDSSSIPEQYDSMLVGHAAFLRAHPDFVAEVQGNCDERGSREYNLALGARRAEAVKKALELSGAESDKLKVVSFGAEKPAAFGQDEESYRQNRRVDIQY